MNKKRTLPALAIAILLSACSASLTELVVVVDSDLDVPATIDAIEITVTHPDGRSDVVTGALSGDGALALPVSLGLVHRGGSLSPVEVVARALRGGAEVVTRTARTGFVVGESRILLLRLDAACVGRTCAPATCAFGSCVAPEVASDALPRFDGTVPPHTSNPDAGAPDAGASDAGTVDGGVLDAPRLDAPRLDAPGLDAPGLDAPNPDAPAPDATASDAPEPDAPAPDAAGCVACSLPNTSIGCTVGVQCEVVLCTPGFDDCDGLDFNGCEASLRTNTHCGACARPCSSPDGTTTCTTGTCSILMCTGVTRGDCNTSATDGCETDLAANELHCGRCDRACVLPQTCSLMGGWRCR